MKLREFNFNKIKSGNPFKPTVLSISYNNGKWYTGFIWDVLNKIPIQFADYNIKETRWFYNEFVIELED